MTDLFMDLPPAKFYACDDPEYLSHDDPTEALFEYLDNDFSASDEADRVAHARSMAPVTVTAYRERPLKPENWVDGIVDRFFGDYEESLHDNGLGDPDGEHEFIEPEVHRRYRRALSAFVENLLEETTVWSCESFASVTLDADHLEAWVREHSPYQPAPRGGAGA